MKNFHIISIVIILLSSVGLIGCIDENNNSNSNMDLFIGTWEESEMGNTMTLFSNGSMISISTALGLSTPGLWELNEDELIFSFVNNGEKNVWMYYYVFSNNNNTLAITLKNSNTTILWERI
jgi:hypothetical protein